MSDNKYNLTDKKVIATNDDAFLASVFAQNMPIYDVTKWDPTGANNLVADYDGMTGTDNSPAFNALLAAIPDRTHCVIYFPTSPLVYDYLFSSTINANLSYKSITFYGGSNASGGSYPLCQDPSGNGWAFTGLGEYIFRNFTIINYVGAVGGITLKITTPTKLEFHRCQVLGSGQYGLKLDSIGSGITMRDCNFSALYPGGGGAALWMYRCSLPLNIDGLIVTSTGKGILFENNCSSGYIRNLYALGRSAGDYNIYIKQYCHDLSLENIWLSNQSGYTSNGIYIDGSTYNLLIDNITCSNMTTWDINIDNKPKNVQIVNYASSKTGYTGINNIDSATIIGNEMETPTKLPFVSGIDNRGADIKSGIAGVKAIGTITFTGDSIAGETLTINGQVHTFVASISYLPNEIRAGSPSTTAAARVAAYFNYNSTQAGNLFALAVGSTVQFIAKRPGVAANAYSFTSTCANATLDGAGFLGGTFLGINPIDTFTVDDTTGNTYIKGDLTVDGTIGGLPFTTVQPSAGDAGIQAAINALSAAGGGIVQLLEGIYVIDTGVKPTAGTSNVTIQGVGAGTILQHDGIYSGECFNIQGINVQSVAINNVTVGDLLITYTTASDAGNVLAGDRVYISGTDQWAETDYQYSIAAANGDSGTGIVTLKSPIQRTLTAVTSRNMRGGENCVIKNLRLTAVSLLPAANGLRIDYGYNCIVDSVLMDNWDGSNLQSAISMSNYGVNNVVKNCNIRNIQSAGGIMIQNQLGTVVRDNFITDVNRTPITDLGGITVEAANADCEISRNEIRISGSVGMECKNIVSRRTSFLDNYVARAANSGLLIRSESTVIGNVIEDCPTTNGISLQFGKKIVVQGNFIKNCTQGIEAWSGNQYCTITGNFIENCSNVGIAIPSGADDNIISNNNIHNVGYVGIWCTGSKAIISNNRIDNVSVLQRGIQLDGSDCSVSGNVITNCFGGGVVGSGSDNIIIGNSCKGQGATLWGGTGNIGGLNKE
jgi:hypothetical protein